MLMMTTLWMAGMGRVVCADRWEHRQKTMKMHKPTRFMGASLTVQYLSCVCNGPKTLSERLRHVFEAERPKIDCSGLWR